MFFEIATWFLISNRVHFKVGAVSMYASAEQTAAPTCAACGKKLGVGYYYACHVCSNCYCYAHAPAKCSHVKPKAPAEKAPLVR